MLNVKQRLIDAFIQTWMAELGDSTRACTYVTYADFVFHSYLSDVNISKYRIALCRLRVSAHKLEIEAGRWHKPVAIPRNDRKCIVCNVLEDEFHFVLECNLYKELREQYLKKYFYYRPSMLKFIELFKSNNAIVNRNLAVYVYKAMELRDKFYMYYG